MWYRLERREDGMHQHFAQHVLSGCFYTLFKANTVAFHLGKEISTVDIEGILTCRTNKRSWELCQWDNMLKI